MGLDYVFETLKAHYRARGLNYRDVARTLKLSEATIKRIFSERNCSVNRLEQLCSVAQVEFSEVARGAPRESRLLSSLTEEQEQELVDDIRLMTVAICAMANWRFEDIVRVYDISEAQCIRLLTRLDRRGFLELLPGNRYRLLVARTFRWIADGPIMRWTKRHAHEYFDHPFQGEGEMLRVVNVHVSAEARVALLSRLEQLASEYAGQHNADAWLPLSDRHALSLCLAVRQWEPEAIAQLRRTTPKPRVERKPAARRARAR